MSRQSKASVQVQELHVTGITDSFLEECLSAMDIEYTWMGSSLGGGGMSTIRQQQLVEKAKWKFGRDVSHVSVLCLSREGWTDWYITTQQNPQEMIDTIGRMNKLRAFL